MRLRRLWTDGQNRRGHDSVSVLSRPSGRKALRVSRDSRLTFPDFVVECHEASWEGAGCGCGDGSESEAGKHAVQIGPDRVAGSLMVDTGWLTSGTSQRVITHDPEAHLHRLSLTEDSGNTSD
jgi:hypothetical protein